MLQTANAMGGLAIQEPPIEPNVIQEDEKAKLKLKGILKGDIRMIKLGVDKHWTDEEIKPFIKKITNEEKFQEIKDKILSNPFNLNDEGYESEVIGTCHLMEEE